MKKGNILDMIFIVVVVAVFAVVGLLALFVNHNVVSPMINNPELQSSFNVSNRNVTAVMEVGSQKVDENVDYIVLLIFIFSSIGMIVLGWVVGGHPVFIPFYIIALIVIVTASIILSNSWDILFSDATFNSVRAYLPITDHILQNLPVYLIIVACVAMVATFGRPRREE